MRIALAFIRTEIGVFCLLLQRLLHLLSRYVSLGFVHNAAEDVARLLDSLVVFHGCRQSLIHVLLLGKIEIHVGFKVIKLLVEVVVVFVLAGLLSLKDVAVDVLAGLVFGRAFDNDGDQS